MLRYDYYIDEERDACDVCDEQTEYLFALSLTNACMHIGKQHLANQSEIPVSEMMRGF